MDVLATPPMVPSSMLSGGQLGAGKGALELTALGSAGVAPAPVAAQVGAQVLPEPMQSGPAIPVSSPPAGLPRLPAGSAGGGQFTTAKGADGAWKLTPAAGSQ